VAALRFFFRVRLKCSDIVEHTTFIHEPRRLPQWGTTTQWRYRIQRRSWTRCRRAPWGLP
jgi:hypothetical protein